MKYSCRVHDGVLPPPSPKPGVVAVGNFDGVHLGHQRIFALCLERARALSGRAMVLTFWPHPAKVLARDVAPPLICTQARKLELIAATGITDIVVLPFTQTLAGSSPADFVDRILGNALGAVEVVIGYDFTFGKGRAGTVDTLRELGAARVPKPMTVHCVAAQTVDGMVASSTKIRQFTQSGNLPAAARLLGRALELEGVVVQGAGRGRTIGIPTANIAVENELCPPNGVYAAWASVLSGPLTGRLVGAAVNIGTNPTFTSGTAGASNGTHVPASTVEAHLLDFDANLYGERLRLALLDRLRGEERFPSAEALVDQINRDIAQVRERLSYSELDSAPLDPSTQVGRVGDDRR